MKKLKNIIHVVLFMYMSSCIAQNEVVVDTPHNITLFDTLEVNWIEFTFVRPDSLTNFDLSASQYIDSLNVLFKTQEFPRFLFDVEFDTHYHYLSDRNPRQSMRKFIIDRVTDKTILLQILKSDNEEFSKSPKELDEDNCYNQEACTKSLKDLVHDRLVDMGNVAE